MTQDERWLERYTEMMDFIESNHRNPSRHCPEERFKYCNRLKHNKTLLNAGEMKEDRVGSFEKLLEGGRRTGVRISMNNRFFTCFWARLCELIIACVFDNLFRFF